MIETLKKTVYIAHRTGFKNDDYGNEFAIYSEPKKYQMNYQPVNGYLDITAYGERATAMKKAVVKAAEFAGKISEGDLAYLDGASPEGETANGQKANYLVVSVRHYNLTTHIYFEKLQKGE